ncbi:MAG: hypothetical protein QMD22_11365, partial [archaeon]|nr:hypothetical protein [archaeon]
SIGIYWIFGFSTELNKYETCLDQRKRAEEELRVSEMQLRETKDLIFENMTDGVYSVSKEYEVEFMNKVLIDEFGSRSAVFAMRCFIIGRSPVRGAKIQR